MKTYVQKLSAALMACSVAFPTLADWRIDESSRLHFLTTKNAQVTEIHTFDEFTGNVSSEGKLAVTVDLSSVNTAIDIRNQRMQEMLFHVAKYAKATFEATLPDSMIKLETGSHISGNVDGILSLHGKAVPTSFSVVVSKLNDNTLTVATVVPTLVKADMFGLEQGVTALKTIAGLSSITTTVPVTFALTLTQ